MRRSIPVHFKGLSTAQTKCLSNRPTSSEMPLSTAHFQRLFLHFSPQTETKKTPANLKLYKHIKPIPERKGKRNNNSKQGFQFEPNAPSRNCTKNVHRPHFMVDTTKTIKTSYKPAPLKNTEALKKKKITVICGECRAGHGYKRGFSQLDKSQKLLNVGEMLLDTHTKKHPLINHQ